MIHIWLFNSSSLHLFDLIGVTTEVCGWHPHPEISFSKFGILWIILDRKSLFKNVGLTYLQVWGEDPPPPLFSIWLRNGQPTPPIDLLQPSIGQPSLRIINICLWVIRRYMSVTIRAVCVILNFIIWINASCQYGVIMFCTATCVWVSR